MTGPLDQPAADQARLVLHTRAGCHLCEPAVQVVRAVAAEAGLTWVEIDVDHPPVGQASAEVLVAAFGDKVPAVTLDGALVAYWRVDADVLRRALAR